MDTLDAVMPTYEFPATEAHVKLCLLNGGSMIAEFHKLHAGAPAEPFRMFDWSFLIHHEKQGRRMLWDLGFSSDKNDYSPLVAGPIWDICRFTGPLESLTEQLLRREGLQADDIDSIIFSHAHYDHCRPAKHTFKNATCFFGPGTIEHCSPGHFKNPSSQWDGRFFDPENATERVQTLQGPWTKFGPFDHAMDIFGDQSFWVIQAPGHMPGNLCACARIETGHWVVLGSDCCHSRAIFDGLEEFGAFDLPDGTRFCLHTDVAAAKDTIARMRIMEGDMGAHIVLAHDTTWMLDENDDVLLSLLDDKFRADIRTAIAVEDAF